jgi:hypothetical protein
MDGGCFLLLCSCKKEDGGTSTANIPRPIEWDESSKMRVSPPNIYGGYARVRQLQDNSLFMVYSDSRGIVGQRSFDLGDTWTDNFLIIPNNPQNFVTNAEVNQLANGDIIVLTTTDGYSKNGAEEVWMIKGKLKDK